MRTALLAILALCAFALPNQAQNPQPVEVPGGPLISQAVPDLPTVLNASVTYGIDPTSPSMQTRWTTADGFQHSITTPKRVGESAGNQAKRHQIAVQALANEVGGPAPSTVPQ